MFTNIKVSNIKGLQECSLLDLGKINVICGKNNSGKSTLLEGIDKHRAVGKKFEWYFPSMFANALSVNHTLWTIIAGEKFP